jgi:hypothetical protein
MTNSELLYKVCKQYIDAKTQNGSVCPTMDDMREIVQLDDINKGLEEQIKKVKENK